MRRIPASKAARSFAAIVDQVLGGEMFIVERRGKPVCKIVPARPRRKYIETGEEAVAFFDELRERYGPPSDEYVEAVRSIRRNQPRAKRPKPWRG